MFGILYKATDRPHLGRKMLAATCGKSSVLHVFAFGGLKRGGSIKDQSLLKRALSNFRRASEHLHPLRSVCVFYVRCAVVHRKDKVRSLAKHVLPPLQLTTEPPKTCLCDVWHVSIRTVFAFKGFKRGGTSRLVFAEACDSKFRHASELLNPFQSVSEVLHGTYVSFIVCVFFMFGVQCK